MCLPAPVGVRVFTPLQAAAALADFGRGGKTINEAYDVLGMRIIVRGAEGAPLDVAAGQEGCYAAEAVVRGLWAEVADRRKDYIAEPKANGYQSLHTAVEVPRGAPPGRAGYGAAAGGTVDCVEVQIRTEAMHESAEEGVAAHMLYKSGLDMQQSARLHDWTQALMQVRPAHPAAHASLCRMHAACVLCSTRLVVPHACSGNSHALQVRRDPSSHAARRCRHSQRPRQRARWSAGAVAAPCPLS
jgi:Region found in RelA / SpoT proteins